ncbi:hypothetical protein GCM10027342_26320 [Photobacterium alginatilyticum]
MHLKLPDLVKAYEAKCQIEYESVQIITKRFLFDLAHQLLKALFIQQRMWPGA